MGMMGRCSRSVIFWCLAPKPRPLMTTAVWAVTLTGKGEGHLIRDGQCVPITWSREKEDMPFTYTLADGSPATLAAGKTYVAVVPPESALDLE